MNRKMGVHPQKLTWLWKVRHLKMYFLLNMWILPCHASFREGTLEFFKKKQQWISNILLIFHFGTLPEVFQLHRGKLTWNPKITRLQRSIIFQTSIIEFHVKLLGCKYWGLNCTPTGCWLSKYCRIIVAPNCVTSLSSMCNISISLSMLPFRRNWTLYHPNIIDR